MPQRLNLKLRWRLSEAVQQIFVTDVFFIFICGQGTISQYFSTLSCPVCQELTHSDLCAKCCSNPQESAVTLLTRMRNWDRTHQHLAEVSYGFIVTCPKRDSVLTNCYLQICYSCCGSRDSKLCCVSLDCPVFYKLVQCTRDVKSSQHLRTILESF